MMHKFGQVIITLKICLTLSTLSLLLCSCSQDKAPSSPEAATAKPSLTVNTNLVCLVAAFHEHPTTASFTSDRCITGTVSNLSNRSFSTVKVRFFLPIDDPNPELRRGYGDAIIKEIGPHQSAEFHAQLLVGAARGQTFELIEIKSFP